MNQQINNKQIIDICEGFKHLAGACFALKQEGQPRPERGANQLFEIIADAIYSPQSHLKTRQMAESWAYEMCLPIITENERQKALMAAAKNQTASTPKEDSAQQHLDPATAALLRTIEENRKSDPLIGAKLGAKEINMRLIDTLKNDKGIHIETLLCALGALAGYACQEHVRAQSLASGMSATANFIVVDGADGKNYFFGDQLNAALAESTHSIWSLAAGAAQHHGCTSLPNITELFKYVTTTIGNDKFGIPRIPTGHQPIDTPKNFVKVFWPILFPTIKLFCPASSEWPILLGLALQEVIIMGKGVIALDLALKIIMESAVPMSKIDLASN